jgi:hypothetical protein
VVMRRWVPALIGVLFVALLPGCVSRKPEVVASCVPAPLPSMSVGPADAAPGGGGLRVVEQGMSRVENGESSYVYSMGAIVENTSAKVAYGTVVTFNPLTEGGQLAADRRSYQLHVYVPVILPGARVPVGVWAYRPAGVIHPPPAVRLEFSFSQVRWAPPGPPFGTISASVTSASRLSPNSLLITNKVHLDSCHRLTGRGIGLVYRNHDGAIIGGQFDTAPMAECDPGDRTWTATTIIGLPDDAVLSRIDLLPYCDPGPGLAKPSPSGPLN